MSSKCAGRFGKRLDGETGVVFIEQSIERRAAGHHLTNPCSHSRTGSVPLAALDFFAKGGYLSRTRDLQREAFMHNSYIVTGRMTDAHTVTLDEDLPLPQERVRVVVELLPPPNQRPYSDVMKVIREQQVRRNHQPKSRDAVDEYLRQERASWDS